VGRIGTSGAYGETRVQLLVPLVDPGVGELILPWGH
jgi:hypothetical protein